MPTKSRKFKVNPRTYLCLVLQQTFYIKPCSVQGEPKVKSLSQTFLPTWLVQLQIFKLHVKVCLLYFSLLHTFISIFLTFRWVYILKSMVFGQTEGSKSLLGMRTPKLKESWQFKQSPLPWAIFTYTITWGMFLHEKNSLPKTVVYNSKEHYS